jgi:hypothetical protein
MTNFFQAKNDVTIIVRHCKWDKAGVHIVLPLSNTGDRNFGLMMAVVRDRCGADFSEKFVLVHKGECVLRFKGLFDPCSR